MSKSKPKPKPIVAVDAMKNETDKGYNTKWLELLTPDEDGVSHWSREDKIVFCPKHLYNHVKQNYSEIYV